MMSAYITSDILNELTCGGGMNESCVPFIISHIHVDVGV